MSVSVNTQHILQGDCPDGNDPDTRDPECLACQELLWIERTWAFFAKRGYEFDDSKSVSENVYDAALLDWLRS